ncbi:uncharacterized protein [Watersipora subatra]|uniref:uncharacterized protein n=1 Tax=Watersipora subatra TaxID=2589382 RepID=UPI00355B845B
MKDMYNNFSYLENSTQELIGTSTPYVDRYREMKIISSVVGAALFVLACVVVVILYKKICKSPHSKTKYGEVEVANGTKSEYYDQFGCDTNELTVNSVTALPFYEENTRLSRKPANTSGSSGVECDSNSDDGKEVQIDTGKRVFHINKVPERNRQRNPKQRVVRLPKGVVNAARSLQASEGQGYTLALIDRNTHTIHNINVDRRGNRSHSRSPLATNRFPTPEKAITPQDRQYKPATVLHQRRPESSSSVVGMVHDSPDLSRHTNISTDEVSGSSGSNRGESRNHSISISSQDSIEIHSTARLLPAIEISGI